MFIVLKNGVSGIMMSLWKYVRSLGVRSKICRYGFVKLFVSSLSLGRIVI